MNPAFPNASSDSMKKAHIGIDPGQSGGIAVVASGRDPRAWKMPETERDVYDLIYSLRQWYDLAPVATIEVVGGFTKAGGGQPGSTMFNFGRGYGGLRMAVIACGIPLAEVRPQAWQKTLGCLTGGDKNVSKAKAQMLFPSLKITHAIADALLIAEWSRQKHEDRQP